MSGVTDLSGTIISGPPNVTDTTFPSMQSTAQLRTSTNPKSWGVCTGVLSRNVASAGVYVTLNGVGPTGDVMNVEFLYLRSSTTLKLRLTQVNGLGTLVSEQYFSGLKIIEVPSTNCITLVEVNGTATIEYLAQGQT